MLLPGSDLCEIRIGPRFARTFLNVAPRVEMSARRPDATIWQMHSVFFQMGAFALKPGGAAAESPELLRDAFEEAIRSGTGESEGFLAFARRPNVHRESGVRDTGGIAYRCNDPPGLGVNAYNNYETAQDYVDLEFEAGKRYWLRANLRGIALSFSSLTSPAHPDESCRVQSEGGCYNPPTYVPIIIPMK